MKSLLRPVLFVAGFLAFFISAKAQVKQLKCGWVVPPMPASYKNDPTAVAKRLAANKKFQALLKLEQMEDTDTLYTLPIVVHVINTGGAIGSPDNPTDAQINAMIANLNNCWRKNGASFGGVDMKIQFQLATRSPSCTATSGIDRVNGSVVPNYASGGITNDGTVGSADQISVKNLSRWPNTDYINIWIVNKIDGSATAPGGFAYFGELNVVSIDGIVLQASVVDGTNKTIAHEMGHIFDLYHTFYDAATFSDYTSCPSNTDCSVDGDQICDTDPMSLQYTCTNLTSCTGSAYTIADIPHNYTVLNNFMGYTDCQWMFTQDQKTRVRASLLAFRSGLLSSGAFTPPPALSPAIACTPVALNGLSPYYGVERLDFNTLHVYSGTSAADGSNYVDHTCNQATTVVRGQIYPITITGSYPDFNPHNFAVYIDYNNNGSFADAGENVLSDFNFNGFITGNISIPVSTGKTGIPLRMRVMADNPAGAPSLAPCVLTGDAGGGSGEAEDYTIILAARQITSVASGAWDAPATWSCNCVPGGDDLVTIKTPHVVTLTAAMGAQQCGNLIQEKGSTFTVSGIFKAIGKQ
jgi:Pregnancy-associated plasma protein-A/GEVED domain